MHDVLVNIRIRFVYQVVHSDNGEAQSQSHDCSRKESANYRLDLVFAFNVEGRDRLAEHVE